MHKIAILYSRTGGGHLSLAYATEEALKTYLSDSFESVLYDPHPAIYAKAYERLSTDLQHLWKQGYHATSSPRIADLVHKLVIPTVIDKLVQFLEKEQPDIVVSNYAFTTVELLLAIKRSKVQAKTVIYFADPFSLHPAWFTAKDADLYRSPTSFVTNLAIEAELPKEKIKTVGWLTRESFFTKPPESADIKTALGLDKYKFTVFIGGSGHGSGKIAEICELFAHDTFLQNHAQCIVNTGLNATIIQKVAKIIQKNPRNFALIPYTIHVRDLMHASDVVVGKAGPNFMFEAIHLQKSILATGCLPGQEEGNIDFIRKHNIGWITEEPEEVIEQLHRCIQSPELLQEKVPLLAAISNEHRYTGKQIAEEIAKLLNT